MPLADYQQSSFTFNHETRPVYRRGKGPGVIIMHEIPGITPRVIQFADRVAEAGFTVFLPSLFGKPGKRYTAGYAAQQLSLSCIRKEFHVLESRGSSPVTEWLRGLCRSAHAELGGPGVGALGMCITGNFALSLMVDDAVMAPVLSQPSLPFARNAESCAALHISDDDLATVKQRTASGCKVLGLRFTNDFMCPSARFERLKTELGDGFEAIEIDSSIDNPDGISRFAHSVLTQDLVDRQGHPTKVALDRVLSFFTERLCDK